MLIFMSKNVLEIPMVRSIADMCNIIYEAGWGEFHAGNLSYILEEEEVLKHFENKREHTVMHTLEVHCPDLKNKYFLVTAAGAFFKNIVKDPEQTLGIIQINDEGSAFRIIWGFHGERFPTSELPTHLLCHSTRLQTDKANRMVLHCHPTYTIAMTFVHELEQANFIKTMWSLNSECVLAFPEGIGVLPWMVCGNGDIGWQSAQKMKEFRTVLWPFHGILVAGRSVDQVMGLLETIEKSAKVFVLTEGKQKQYITVEQIRDLANAFNLKLKEDVLSNVD